MNFIWIILAGVSSSTLASAQVILEPVREVLEKYRSQGIIREVGFAKVPAGTFSMGCDPTSDDHCHSFARPHHPVTLSEFEIQDTELTMAQWVATLGVGSILADYSPEDCPANYISEFKICPNRPAAQITKWDIEEKFLPAFRLQAKQRGDACEYSLPTEAQWEYVARNGATTTLVLEDSENYRENPRTASSADNRTLDVASLSASGWGVYDILGNVSELVADDFETYAATPRQDPRVVREGGLAVLRGSNFLIPIQPVWNRHEWNPDVRTPAVGFRLARKCPKP
jgi:formylglycine-generating enzyme required for sulfatase activity